MNAWCGLFVLLGMWLVWLVNFVSFRHWLILCVVLIVVVSLLFWVLFCRMLWLFIWFEFWIWLLGGLCFSVGW